MRYVCLATAAAAVFCFLAVPDGRAQDVQGLSVDNYQFVSEQRWSRTQSYVTYRADLVNVGAAKDAITATVTSSTPSVQVVPGQANLHFSPVPAGGRTTSTNAFTILVDRTVPFDFKNLQWSFLTPVANAGDNITAAIGQTVSVNASRSTNPSGIGNLSYKWSFVSRPFGTAAKLLSADSVIASFTVDVPGDYVLMVTVSNGVGADTATVTVSTVNSPPVANAGANQTVGVGSIVHLNGAASSDVDGDALTYSWTLVSRPANSSATLLAPKTVTPSFTADKPGTYVAQLIVNDGKVDSAAATVTITTQNTAPVANAGPNQAVSVGAVVQLNGAGSTDVDGDALTYHWSFNTVPAGSSAHLSDANAVNPTFTADAAGTYVVQLIVNDGYEDSAPITVTVTTNTIQAPTAYAGLNQTVKHGELVLLNGTGSDPQGLPLTYHWSFTTKPAGSTATLSNSEIARPTFTADFPGQYVVQLIVNNGYIASAASTVTVTTTNTPPVANAGVNQTAQVGATVSLDGSASTDADGDALTYSWSLITRPAGSNAILSAANSASPTFLADVAGTYVAQLIVNDKYANSDPATVTISVGVKAITLTPSPLNLPTNSSGTLTITLGSPAGAGGLLVHLASSETAVVTVPQSVTIAENESSATVDVVSRSAGTALLLATATGFSPGTVTANVTVPSIALAVDSSTIGVTGTTKATITLSVPAPAGGLVVSIGASPSGVVTVPASITIASGTTGTFTVTGAAVGSATLTASVPGYNSGSAGITVSNLGAIHLTPNVTVGPNQTAPLAVTLATPAPVNGVTISLTSSDQTVVTVSQSVFIPQGATSPQTPAQVTGVNFGSASITASAPGFLGETQQVKVTGTLSFSPGTLTVGAGGSANLTLNLSAPAPPGLTIHFTSDGPTIATVPSSLEFPTTATTLTVPVTGVAAGTTTIHASSLPSLADTTATISVAVLGSINLPQSATVGLGQTAIFPVSLSVPAPAGGTILTLTSSNTAVMTISPTTVNISAGQTTPSQQPQITGVAPGTVNITAKAPAFGTANAVATVTAALSFSPANIDVQTGGTQTVTVNVTAASPNPIAVSLTSDNTSVVTVPASVVIPANAVGATVTVTGVGAGSTKIRATASGLGPAEAIVTVATSGHITVPASTSVALSKSAPFPISLPAAAAAPVTITLSSSDTAKVTVSPTTVTIAAGATAPTTQPQVTGVSIGTANVTASAPGYPSGTGSVSVTAALSFSPASITVATGATANVTLNLSGSTPAALTISLSSDNTAIATVPAAVIIPANASSVTVVVTGTGGGSTTVRATGPTGVTAGTLAVSGGAEIILPTEVSVAPGEQTPLQISLAKPAGADTVYIQLASSDTSKATLQQSTIAVPPGATQPTSMPRVNGVNFGTATITASGLGLAPASTTVKVGAALAFTPSSLTMAPSSTQTLGIALSAAAPSGGLPVSLASSNASVVTVPSTVTIPAGQSSVLINVTSLATGTATVTASTNLPTVSGATASVTVATPGSIVIPTNFSVGMGDTVAYPVTLSSPAGGNGVSITLAASGNISFVPLTCVGTPCQPIPPNATQTTVFVPAGQTSPSSQPQVRGVSPGPLTITASAAGYAAITKPAQVTASFAFSPQSLGLNPGTTASLMLAFSGPVPPPPTGLTVTLTSSNTGVATVQTSVTAFWDGSSPTTLNVPVTAVGAGTVTIRASAANMADATATVTVAGPLTISTTALPGGVVNRSYSGALVAGGGTSPYTWSATGLPAGLTLNTSTGAITGSPTSAGNTTVTVTVTDSTSPTHQTATKAFSITIVPALEITTASLPNGVANSAYSAALTITGGVGPFNWSITGLPAGLTFNAGTGAISGTPLAASTSTVAVSVTDSTSPTPQTATKNFSLTIGAPLAITTQSLPGGTVNTAYSASVAATGGTSPYAWAITGLPAGLTFNATTGAISGTPTASGTSTVSVTVTDSTTPTHLSASKSFTLSIGVGVSITTNSLPDGVVGAAYSASVAASGGLSPYTWSATGLPAGLTLNPTTGAITGTPTAGGASTVSFTATDSSTPAHQTATKTLSITIGTALTITTNTLPAGIVNSPYTGAVAASGGTTPLTWAITGLPAGLTVNTATGAIAGTPTTVGTSTLTVTVTDSTSPNHQTASKNLTIIIGPPLSITTTALPGGTVNAAYTGSVAATGGTAPYTWAITGLPAGLAFDVNTGAISGTPTAAGTSTVSVTATDSTAPTHQTATKTLTITIGAALTITTTSLASGTVNLPYSATVAASGGAQPYTWSMTGLPAGLIFNSTTGAISGTPTAAGSSTVSVSVTDSTAPTHQTATKSLSLTIALPVPASIVAVSGGGQAAVILTQFANPLQVSVKDAGGNAVSGASVIFTAPASGASATFATGGITATVQTNASGLATSPALTANGTAGGYNVVATVASLPGVSFALTNSPPPPPPLQVSNVSIGKNLQANITISLPAAADVNVPVTIASGSPTRLLLGPTGTASLTPTIPAGQTQIIILAQALDSTGAVTVTASASGYSNGSGTVTLTPSGFVLAGPNDVGVSFDASAGSQTTMTVFSARLNASGGYAEKQPLRNAYGSSVSVQLTSTSAGTISPTSVAIDPGSQSAQATFTAGQSAGSATVTAQMPSGFTALSDGKNAVVVTILPPGLIMPTGITVGRNLQTTASVGLNGIAPPAGLQVTVTSNDPARLRFSTSATVSGSGSITLNLPANAHRTSDFYVQALDSSGTVGFTATAPGFGTANGLVTLAQSAVVFTNSFGGVPNPILAAAGGSSVPVTVYTAIVDGGGNWVATQPLAGGSSATVSVTNTGSASVGVTNPTQVTIQGGNSSGNTQFVPNAAGDTTLAVTVPGSPTGFSVPSDLYRTLGVKVSNSRVVLSNDPVLGKDLQGQGTAILTQAAPAGGLSVTLTSNSPDLRLSTSSTSAGQTSISVTVPAGSTTATYYVQALASSGTATYTATATGYASGTASVDLAPSGVVLSSTIDLPFMSVAAGDTAAVLVRMARLDPATNFYVEPQPLRGGLTLNVTVGTGNSGIATVETPVLIQGGALPGTIATPVHGVAAGTTNITVTQPSGFVAAANPLTAFKPMPSIQLTVN